ncbi:alpha/beta hydrolase fold domain-containing protein [Litorimonas sp. RW-G-Af-16]|uniref:alpha/beta hydrolase fold domain-containing protein n=1 Tax=Litorimonas sp. RW-G-Af-16 TaxID=3241168 RepID=UPI00390CD163
MTSLRYKMMQGFLRATRFRFRMLRDAKINNPRYTTPRGNTAKRYTRTEFEGHAVWTVHPKSGPTERVYVHEHGGGYVYAITDVHWGPIAELAEQAGITIIMPEYPLPPVSTTDIHDWACRHYASVSQTYGAENVWLGGDSAGGNLALVIAQKLAGSEAAPRNPLVLWSPWVNLTPLESISKDDDYEALITPYGLEPAVSQYAPNWDRTNPLISPTFADLSTLPAMHIITGGRDILHPQIMEFSAKLKAAGKLAGEIIAHEYGHYWMFYPVPDRHKTLRQIADILRA